MQIKVQDYCEDIAKQNYDWQSLHLTCAQIKSANLAALLSAFYVQFAEDLQNNRLAKLQIIVDDAPALLSFAVETSIINLPWADTKKIINFFDNDDVVPLNLYFITESPSVNVSNLRIDEFASVTAYLHNLQAKQAELTKLLPAKLATLQG